MRRQLKTQLTDIMQRLKELNRQLLVEMEQEGMAALGDAFADEQDAMISVGNRIEETEGQGTEAVRLLESGCELLWRLSQAACGEGQEQAAADGQLQEQILGSGQVQKQAAEGGQLWESLEQLLDQVCREIENLPEQIVAVFLPYKASMWDCMESVWKAACADPLCIPYVIPVPYFDLKDGQVLGRRYEGYDLPDYVPVTDYRKISLEELRPEMAYLHNPFDEYNLVTRLLPEYFSGSLKKYVQKLVYIPYYVTGDAVYVTHRFQPSYHNFDYIVTQSEKMIDSYDPVVPREKFLPFGSPIADRILYMEEHKPEIPQEWKSMLPNGKDFGGKRTIMLNTSISLFLQQRGRFLDKLEYIFKLVRGMDDILLIWRPHPLLRATAESLAADLAERLQSLEERFLKEKLGVLDRESDVGVTVALCDAYLGETASSMVHMFGIAGKPKFYINLTIPQGEDFTEGKAGEKERLLQRMGSEGLLPGGWTTQRKVQRGEDGSYSCEVSCRCVVGEKEYFILNEYGWILERSLTDGEMRPVAAAPGFEICRKRAYRCMEAQGQELVLYPEEAEGILYYDLHSGQMRKIFDKRLEMEAKRNKMPLTNEYVKVSEGVIAVIRAELFKKGKLDHTWYEGDEYTLQDFFYFMQTAGKDEMTGYTGVYQIWLATMDGTCGQKIYDVVKGSLG